ncbi:MAG: transporter substrate-binding protein [Amycolatopsis sp.]|jgi:polar amino acid transport system substrate-binding protein|uniref:ABC transporter substrate-binding protein n=1 Tax=Amycolatopsis sp. TaxID=37632 RepID=UPI00262FC790|nr:ABC transporter substrate-binding protein [Amycolatopsis sp.]MCU1681596.1 transporter substrate-binding protein [Amycolatopsis sp.]
MNKTLLATAAVALMFAVTACGGSGDSGSTIRVVTLSDSPPNAFVKDGVYTGFDNELLKDIANKEGLKLEFVATDFSALLGRVAGGQSDIASCAIAATAERKKTVDFSAPYNYQSLAIQVKQTSPITGKSGLAGKRVGVVQGTASETWVAANEPTAQLVRFPNDSASLGALKTDAIDATVFDQDTAEAYVKANPDAHLKIAEAFATDTPHGFAFKKGNTSLIGKINDGIKKDIADGTWERLHHQFIPNAPQPAEFLPPKK